MNQDVQKFLDALKDDKSLQEKMKHATEAYEGERTQEAVFHGLISRVAEEAGFHFTWDDFQEYVKQEAENAQQLNADEMDQVAGGYGKGKGYGGVGCSVVGLGLGGAGGNGTGGGCFFLGFGWGGDACWGDGETIGPFEP